MTQIIAGCRNLSKAIKNKHITHIVAIARGGIVPARFICKFLDIRRIYTIGMEFYTDVNETKKTVNVYQSLTNRFNEDDSVLIIDDIADRGYSMLSAVEEVRKSGAKNITTCTLYYKDKSIVKPDFYYKKVKNNDWIMFPFE